MESIVWMERLLILVFNLAASNRRIKILIFFRVLDLCERRYAKWFWDQSLDQTTFLRRLSIGSLKTQNCEDLRILD